MICYAKLNANSNSEELFQNFFNLGCDEEYIFLDPSVHQKEEGSVYQEIKKLLLQEKKTFVIDSLKSLGKNNREIAKELAWFLHNNISLNVLNIPSTANNSASPLQVLWENYEFLAAVEIKNVKENQRIGIEKAREANKNLGRKKIPYPKEWNSNYTLWTAGKITSEQFRENVGLKKGTFYNLIKQYKIEIAEQEQKGISVC